MLEKLFRLQESGTTVKREIVAGCTTFMTLSYIIFVQPAVLSAAGMDPGAVMVATCIASALAMMLMGFLANYPIALAPGMGHNFYFTFTVCLTLGVSWQHALGAVFITGALFILLAFVGLRETAMNTLPVSLRNAIRCRRHRYLVRPECARRDPDWHSCLDRRCTHHRHGEISRSCFCSAFYCSDLLQAPNPEHLCKTDADYSNLPVLFSRSVRYRWDVNRCQSTSGLDGQWQITESATGAAVRCGCHKRRCAARHINRH